MSVIQTIRNRYAKIAGGVIAVALIGFIVSDARNGSFANLFGGHDPNVMKVNGTKIDPKEYQTRVKEYETLYSMFNKNRPLDDQTRSQMNDQVVQMVVYETIAGEECDKLGITGDDDKELIYGENADQLIRQFQIEGQPIFVNGQTGQFDPQMIKQFEEAITKEPTKYDPSGKLREQWVMVKSYVKRMSRINKYNALFAASTYTPMYFLKRSVEDQGAMASVKYVKVPYTVIPDADVKVSDDEIKEYLKKHSAAYSNDQPTRSIEYVSFDIIPSSADTGRQVDALEQIKTDFAAAKDNKSFVNSKSEDAGAYSEAYLNKRTFMSRFADTISALPVGTVFGPYFENGGYRLSKVVDRKTLPDSVKVRHILVKTKDRSNEVMSDTAASMKLDSAIAAINAGGKWDSIVNIYSMDDGSKKTAGEYWFTLQQRPTISKEFGDFAFEGKPGEKKKIKVTNDNYSGYHYIEVMENKNVESAVQLATIVKPLGPSDSTGNAIFGKANEFAQKNTTAADFDATIKKQNLDKRVGDNIKINTFSITGLGPSREIIRWAFAHKVGEISSVFQLSGQRYVVAKLTGIQEKGAPVITTANRPMLEQKVREEKKAEMITKKYTGALEAIASSSGQQVQQSDSVALAGGYIPGLGYEPKVVGYAFCQSFQPNAVSPGIKGQGGVYFITILKRGSNPIDPNMMQMMMAQQRYQMEGQLRNGISQMLQQSVIRRADVKYNAENF
jgi:peptidyl-prolyl cis-trans isomerase D